MFWHHEAGAHATPFACAYHLSRGGSDRLPLSMRIDEYDQFLRSCHGHPREEWVRREVARLRDSVARPARPRPPRPILTPPQPKPGPPPPPFPSPPLPPSPPPPPPPMLSRMIVVDDGGNGDARTMVEALSLVREGGIIRVRPGRYHETIRITKPVTVVGDRDARFRPVFDNMIVDAVGTVRLEAVGILGNNVPNALRVQAGDVELVDCVVSNQDAVRQGTGMTAAIVASDGHLDIDGGVMGPGGDVAIIATGVSRLSVRGARIIGGAGYGLYGTGRTQISMSDTNISGLIPVIFNDHSNIVLSGNTIIGSPHQYIILVSGDSTGEIMSNRISINDGDRINDAADRNWLRIAPTVSRMRILGNRSASGRRLRVPDLSSEPPRDRSNSPR